MDMALLAEVVPTEHPWLEYVSWVASAVVAVAALAALIQVWAALKAANISIQQTAILVEQLKIASSQLIVSTKDVEVRSKREALSMALEQCKRFATEIVPHIDKTQKQMLALGYMPPPTPCDPDFPFIPKEMDLKGVEIWSNQIDLRTEIVHALNELESFAMYFTLDLADEQAAFPPAAQTICGCCEYYRLFIGSFRSDSPDRVKLYQNLVKLYGMWKPRLTRSALEEQGKLLEKKKQLLPADKVGIPIGTKVPLM
jgi:hypothetical protein